jgi:large-conductance mechanosensitive channel
MSGFTRKDIWKKPLKTAQRLPQKCLDFRGALHVTLNLGVFINTIISFIIIAFAVILVIKGIKLLAEANRPILSSTFWL